MANNLLMATIYPHPPIMIPEVGKGEIKKVEKTINAARELSENIVQANPDTIVIITPHSIFDPYYFSVYSGKILSGNFANFRAPQVKISFENDIEFINKLETNIEDHFKVLNKIPERMSLDHGSAVPLYYIGKAGYKGKIVVINYCALGIKDHLYFGELIRKTMSEFDKKFIFIASGDLSHRITPDAPAGYNPHGKIFDSELVKNISEGNYDSIVNIDQKLREEAGECAFNSLMVAFGLLDIKPKQNKVYSYEAPFGVGYAVASL